MMKHYLLTKIIKFYCVINSNAIIMLVTESNVKSVFCVGYAFIKMRLKRPGKGFIPECTTNDVIPSHLTTFISYVKPNFLVESKHIAK